MAEYIEREAALRTAHIMRPEDKGLETELMNIPAADVAPVVHSRWLTWEEMFPSKTPKKKNNLGVFCGSCKNHADNTSDYCPHCGARMDGDAERKNT